MSFQPNGLKSAASSADALWVTEVLPSPFEAEGAEQPVETAPPARKAPFSRRSTPPVGAPPPERTSSGELADIPAAMFRNAKPAQPPTPASTTKEPADSPELQRVAALEARRTEAAERPSWFSPPTAPVSGSPFALVSSRPETEPPTPSPPAAPSPEALAQAQAVEAALAEQRAVQAAYEAEQARLLAEARQAQQAAEATAAAHRAELQRLHTQAGTTVVHPDALRGALLAPTGPPTPVIPPLAAQTAAVSPAQLFADPGSFSAPAGLLATSAPVTAALPAVSPDPGPAGVAAAHEPAVEPGRKPRLRRPGRKGRQPAAEPAEVEARPAAEERRIAEDQAHDAALEAYRRYAREGTMVTEDYYRGPTGAIEEEAAPKVVIADSLIPTGKPRLAPQPDKPRGPKIAAAVVVLALAGGGYYWHEHQPAPVPVTGTPALTLDQTTATTSADFTVPAAATSGPSYRLTVPAGWKAVSQPTRNGGNHEDVTVSEPILGLSVRVDSNAAGTSSPVKGTPVDTALRVFGRPAGIIAPATAPGSATVSRVATVTLHGVRYSVTLTVPRESASRDYGRADVIARSLTDTR